MEISNELNLVAKNQSRKINYNLIFKQDTKSPYYLGEEKVLSLLRIAENTLSGFGENGIIRSAKFTMPQLRLGKDTGRVIDGFVIEHNDIRILSIVFGELAKVITVEQTVSFPIEIHPEGLTDTYAKFLEN